MAICKIGSENKVNLFKYMLILVQCLKCTDGHVSESNIGQKWYLNRECLYNKFKSLSKVSIKHLFAMIFPGYNGFGSTQPESYCKVSIEK